MELKKRIIKSYSVSEMMTILNKDFIGYGGAYKRYVLLTTCFNNDEDRFAMVDSRFAIKIRVDEHSEQNDPDFLQSFYASTMEEAVSKAFNNSRKHNG